jgi:hypothetical protein
MITPNPRGFPRQTQLIAADNIGGGCDLAALFPPPRARIAREQVAREQVARATCETVTDEAKKLIYLNREKEKRSLPYAECVATVTHGATVFFFRTTSLGATVLDSRDKSRRSICHVRRELERLLGDAARADTICAELVAVQPPPKVATERPAAASDPAYVRPPAPAPLKRAIFSARKRLLADPLLAYLTRPMTELPESMR